MLRSNPQISVEDDFNSIKVRLERSFVPDVDYSS